ncbi:MAG: major capsid protein [Candidatus Nanopelagicales bacterium]
MASADEFTADLQRLADMDSQELSDLESRIMAAFDAADEANDEATMQQLADALDQVRGEIEKKGGEAPAAAPEPVPAAAEVAAAEPIIEDKKEEEDPTVASVDIPKDRAPKTMEEPVSATTITAAADIPGYSAGAEFPSLEVFADAFAKRINTLNRLSGGDGERVLVASIKSTVSDDRMLQMNDPEGNREKIMAITEPKAIMASGGCCAPLTTRYDLYTIGETARPVRDSLAGFQADRGGIRFFSGPTLASLGTATGFWNCDADAAYVQATPSTWKICARIDCPPEKTALTQAVTMCLVFGVISSRVFPENVTANTKLALVQHARLADSALLAAIKADSTPIAGPAVKFGAVRDLLLTVARVAAWYRDRHRLGREIPLRAILPVWVLEMLRADLIVQPPAGDGRVADFGVSSRDVENFFDQWGVRITWTLDGPSPSTLGGGTFGPLVATPSGADAANVMDLPPFPTTVQWVLYAEGAWLFLDGGSLDLGIVRDSTLVRANDYMQFSETFESAVRIGGESLWITSPIDVLGQYSHAIA